MAVAVSYPGVYIEEFTPASPIQGAATSVTALLGPAAKGPILTPTLVTSWDQFKQLFGVQPLAGFFSGTRRRASSKTAASSCM